MPDDDAPKPTPELPEPFRTLKWIRDSRPKNASEFALLTSVCAITFVGAAAVGDGAYGAYKHSKGIRHKAIEVADKVAVSAEKQVKWIVSQQPSHNRPVPSPLYFSQDSINNSNSSSQLTSFSMVSLGTSSASITPGYSVSASSGTIGRDGKVV